MADNILQTYWPYLAAAFGGVVWLIRLEGKQKQTEKNVDTLTDMHKSESTRLLAAMDKMAIAQEKTSEQIANMRETLAAIVAYEKGAHEATKAAKAAE
jgi:hypothetical protein